MYDYERETATPMEWSWIWLWGPPVERYEYTRIASERLWVNAVSGAFCLIVNTTILLTMIYRPSGHRNHKDDICIGANLLHDAVRGLQRLSFSIHAFSVYADHPNCTFSRPECSRVGPGKVKTDQYRNSTSFFLRRLSA